MNEVNGTQRAEKCGQKAARAELLKRVQFDFTYKSNFNDEQKAFYNGVRTRFEDFRKEMDDLLTTIPKRSCNVMPAFSIHYTCYKYALREVERRCNAAIANDWATGDPLGPEETTENIVYDGPSGGTEFRNRVCDEISKRSSELICELVQFLPLGNSLKIAITRMADVRGWLLDAVNLHWKEE